MVISARRNGKPDLAAAVAYMQARYGGPQPTPWQLRVLTGFGDPGAGQDGFAMMLDDGMIMPVPLPALDTGDGSGYTRGGIPAGAITGLQLSSGPVAVSINAARAGLGLPPFPPQAAISPAPPQPPAPGRKPGSGPVPSRRPLGQGRSYSRGMDGFDGWELPPAPDLTAGDEIPDVFGVVRGYRWWTLDAPPLHESPAHADRMWKRSLLRGMQATWEPGENRATCRAGAQKVHPEQTVPDIGCGCGFWAYWHLQRHEVGGSALPVCGVIEGYGAVLIGEKGFRAAKARIVALHLPFTIMPVTEVDDDPMGLGLPPSRQPSARSGAYHPHGPGGRRNPWWNHPQFTGRVHNVGGYHPDTGEYYDPASGSPVPAPDLSEPSADERQAARDTAEAWMAVIGDRLAQVYPDARICETRELMEELYPPDVSYVPDRTPVCPECGNRTNGDVAGHLRYECTA
jgi:hypothetical protein